MPNQLKSARELVNSSRFPVPESWKGQMLILEFATPIPQSAASNFLRVGLTAEQLAGGEDGFRMVNIVQPTAVIPTHCDECKRPLRRMSDNTWTCYAARCKRFALVVQAGPRRGVVQTMTFRDFEVVDPESGDVKLCALALVLDRRYHESVLLTIRNMAGQLCEMMGWKLL